MPVFCFLFAEFSKEKLDNDSICFLSLIWPIYVVLYLPRGLFLFFSFILKWFTFLFKIIKKYKPKEKSYKDIKINNLEQYQDLKKAVNKFSESLGRNYG